MGEFLIEASDLKKSYPTPPDGKLTVLRGLSFGIKPGQFVAIVGESGTGKSTLLHLLGALDRPTGGSVFFDGEDVFQKGDKELARLRNESIGFVFQFHHLLPEFSALENVAMPALIGGQTLNEARPRAEELLDILKLSPRMHQRPAQLSGGEQQRVAVARALMNRPKLVIADEPTGNLDMATAGRLHEELLHLSRSMSQTFVIATHNPALAEMADRVLSIQDGYIVELPKNKEG